MFADTLTLGSCAKRCGIEARERASNRTHHTGRRNVEPDGRILLEVNNIELLDKESIGF